MRKVLSLAFLLSVTLSIRIVFPRTIYGQIDLDSNGDGIVDGVEFSVWLSHYNQGGSQGAIDGDFDRSGFVDGVDFSVWLANYGRTITQTPTHSPTSPVTGTRIPTPTPGFCYVKIAGYIYNMQSIVGVKMTDQISGKSRTHTRGNFRCGTLTNPTDVTSVYLDKHKPQGCWQRIAPYIVTPPAPLDPTCQ